MYAVALLCLAGLVAVSRGWFRRGVDGAPVVEPVVWVPSGADDLGDQWQLVRIDPDGRWPMLGWRLDPELYLLVVASLVVALMSLVVGEPVFAVLWLLGTASFAACLHRADSMGLYLSGRGVQVRRLVGSHVVPWIEVGSFELREGRLGEHVSLVETSGRVHQPVGYARPVDFASRRLPVGPMRWRMHAYEDLVDQLEAIAAAVRER